MATTSSLPLDVLQNCACPGAAYGANFTLKKMNRGHRSLIDFTRKLYRIPPQAQVLDIGCGGGAHLAKLLKKQPTATVYGVDISPLSVRASLNYNKKAVRQGRIKVLQASVEKLPFADAQFQVVTASETVYFWPDLVANFREVARVLAPGGLFMVCVDSDDPQAMAPYMARITGMRTFTRYQLIEAAQHASFKDYRLQVSKQNQVCLLFYN